MVIDYFKKISSIPRGSKYNTLISNFLVSFAKEHNLEYIQDESENVVIFKEGSSGHENAPVLIMQGHMDMVCEKVNEDIHDFKTEGLKLVIDNGFMSAEGTTLGADDGIALAYMLEFLADETLEHPPFEMVFTTDEEIGMDGARALDASCLKGRYMINLDSEEEGIFLASCAGGMTGIVRRGIVREEKNGVCLTFDLKGLKGGHSGTEIDKNRGNAAVLCGRILAELPREDFSLLNLYGGHKDNVIPNEASFSIVVDKNKVNNLIKIISDNISIIKDELAGSEPDIKVISEFDLSGNNIMPYSEEKYSVLTVEDTDSVVNFLNLVPNGVHVMSSEIAGMVESSSNLGIFELNDKEMMAVVSMRSPKKSYIDYISSKISLLAYSINAGYSTKGAYPGWNMKRESKFRDLICDVYEKVTGRKSVVSSIHAGLEGGIFMNKIPDLDIVSMGPDTFDIHTVKERLDLESVERIYKFLKEAIREFAKTM